MKFLTQLIWMWVVLKLANSKVRVDPLVQINQGLIRGKIASDGNYAAFLGIPYAKVNTDDPFGLALPAENFEDTFNAYDGSITCPQISMSMPGTRAELTLDCLRLNVFVPHDANSQSLLPVMVYIHGGSFEGGSAQINNVYNLIKNEIILVTINYRLGPYGFMCLNIPEVSGNTGLKDQHKAIEWVNENIHAFGGDPSDITIAGGSAGSCSVLLHLFSPSKKLFNKVIAQSGTPQTFGMFVSADTDAAIKLSNYLEYNTNDTYEAIEFLKKQSPNSLITAYNELKLSFRPCEELEFEGIERFIDNNPFSLTNVNKINSTPIIIGHASREEMKIKNDDLAEFDNLYSADIFYEKLRYIFQLSEEELVKLSKIVKNFYIGDSNVSVEVKTELEDFESDFYFNYLVQRIINFLLEESANPLFQYVFSYTGDSGAAAASHGDDLQYLFGSSNTINENDKIMQERFTTLLANFVKYGNPTPEVTELLPVTWEPVSADKRPYLNIDASLEVKHSVFKDRMAFWDLIYSVYLNSHVFIHN